MPLNVLMFKLKDNWCISINFVVLQIQEIQSCITIRLFFSSWQKLLNFKENLSACVFFLQPRSDEAIKTHLFGYMSIADRHKEIRSPALWSS